MLPPIPVVLRPSGRYFAWTVVALAASELGGLIMLPRQPMKGAFVLVVMTALILALVVRFARNPKVLDIEMNENGIWGPSLGKGQTIPWADLTAIRIGWTALGDCRLRGIAVFLDYSRGGQSGSVRIWPHVYGFNAEELVAVISQAYERTRVSPAPISTK